jgi:ribosome modulation factor
MARAKQSAANDIGHNSNREADERRARLAIIVGKLLEVDARMQPLRDERKTIRAEAKAEFKLAMIDAAVRISTMEDQSIFVDEIKELIEIAKAFNALPPGEQGDLFPDRRDGAERAFDEGKVAGLNGKNPEAPDGFDPTKWMDGWHAGQEVRRDEMQRDMERRNAAAAELIQSGANDDGDPGFADAAE